MFVSILRFPHHCPTSLLNYFCPTLPCFFVPIPPITLSSFDIIEAYFYVQPPQAIFCIHVTMFALLYLLLTAPPLCPNFPVFPSIDPSFTQDFFPLGLVPQC